MLLFGNVLEMFWFYIVYFTISFVYSFLSTKTRVVGFECSFTYRYCCFKTIVSTITRFFFTILYIDSLLTTTLQWFGLVELDANRLLLFFKYCFATKLSCIGFEPIFMWLCRPLNYVLISLFTNLPNSGVPLTYMFIIFPIALLPCVLSLLDFLQFY